MPEREIDFKERNGAEAEDEDEWVAPVHTSQPREPSVHLALRPGEFLGWLISGALFAWLGNRLRYRMQHPKQHRISTRQLVVWSLVLLMVGAIVTAAGGGSESESSTAQIGISIAAMSFIGFWWAMFREGFNRLVRIYQRFFDDRR